MRTADMDRTTWLEYFVTGLATELQEVRVKGEQAIRADVLAGEAALNAVTSCDKELCGPAETAAPRFERPSAALLHWAQPRSGVVEKAMLTPPPDLWHGTAEKSWVTEGPNSGGIAGYLLWQGHVFRFEHEGHAGRVEPGVPVEAFVRTHKQSDSPRLLEIVRDLERG